tara:strand:+ start:1755 stop:2618 length:864 start_codon:yes stop_codon:yes gene_type:complete
MDPHSIAALMPETDGHQFVFYGDCCSGIPGAPFASNFAQVNAALQRLQPQPDFILFLGDHIMGAYAEEHDLKGQWRYWFEREMAWLDADRVPIYHTTSNHNTLNAAAEDVWREVLPDIPDNGPPGQEGLSYWVRRDDLLLVVVNTSYSGLGGPGHVESDWLHSVLSAHRDARHKIVAGHHPALPVNGYDERPQWCIARSEAEPFWQTLVQHGVLAYFCSHIIAFDVQEHQGVVQICSGGAGTNYGPGGFMGAGEYHHFAQAALDEKELRLQTIDADGRIRERFSHPS